MLGVALHRRLTVGVAVTGLAQNGRTDIPSETITLGGANGNR
jgi:hypothetical protein